MLTPRFRHSSCALHSDDGSIKCIIIIGGFTDPKRNRKTTEILHLTERKWVQGPILPEEISDAACAALPPTSHFACVIVGGSTTENTFSSNVYSLDKSLSKWTVLGKIRKGRYGHIALPIS